MTVKTQVEWFLRVVEGSDILKNKLTICQVLKKGDGSYGISHFYFLTIPQIFNQMPTVSRFCSRSPTVPATESGTFAKVPCLVCDAIFWGSYYAILWKRRLRLVE